jgi:hypothetical protein
VTPPSRIPAHDARGHEIALQRVIETFGSRIARTTRIVC